jgi:hypothetical protein
MHRCISSTFSGGPKRLRRRQFGRPRLPRNVDGPIPALASPPKRTTNPVPPPEGTDRTISLTQAASPWARRLRRMVRTRRALSPLLTGCPSFFLIDSSLFINRAEISLKWLTDLEIEKSKNLGRGATTYASSRGGYTPPAGSAGARGQSGRAGPPESVTSPPSIQPAHPLSLPFGDADRGRRAPSRRRRRQPILGDVPRPSWPRAVPIGSSIASAIDRGRQLILTQLRPAGAGRSHARRRADRGLRRVEVKTDFQKSLPQRKVEGVGFEARGTNGWSGEVHPSSEASDAS